MKRQWDIEVQYACGEADLPPAERFQVWAQTALAALSRDHGELVIRLVDAAEAQQLNQIYRGKEGPTNVLSFPFEAPPGVPLEHLGDLAICIPVVRREAAEQHKPLEAHLAHLVVHGTLHLLGQDHQSDAEAEAMEALEIAIMGRLGYPDPYQPGPVIPA